MDVSDIPCHWTITVDSRLAIPIIDSFISGLTTTGVVVMMDEMELSPEKED